MLVLGTIFGLLSYSFMDDYVVVVDLVIYTGYLSRGIASLICVVSTECAGNDVSPKDISLLLL